MICHCCHFSWFRDFLLTVWRKHRHQIRSGKAVQGKTCQSSIGVLWLHWKGYLERLSTRLPHNHCAIVLLSPVTALLPKLSSFCGCCALCDKRSESWFQLDFTVCALAVLCFLVGCLTDEPSPIDWPWTILSCLKLKLGETSNITWKTRLLIHYHQEQENQRYVSLSICRTTIWCRSSASLLLVFSWKYLSTMVW